MSDWTPTTEQVLTELEAAVERARYNCECQVGGVDALSLDTDWLQHRLSRLRAALAQHDAEVKAAALREWINEWPTTPDDGTFLADVAREGRDRADRIEGSAS